MNGRCGTRDSLTAFETQVLAHERDVHEASLNDCLSSQHGTYTMSTLESLLGTDADETKNQLQNVWDAFYEKRFVGARTGRTPPATSPKIWEHRLSNSWQHHQLGIGGHDGTHGC